jgi:hypothetical protein
LALKLPIVITGALAWDVEPKSISAVEEGTLIVLVPESASNFVMLILSAT